MSDMEGLQEDDIYHEAKENLKIASSVASFRASHIELFRQELSRSIKQVLFLACSGVQKESTETLRCIRYRASRLEEGFSNVDWKELCQFHDGHVERTASKPEKLQMKSTTPLQEITALIKDPTVIPLSCCNSVTKLLVGALLQSPRQYRSQKDTSGILPGSRWSHAQLLLLKCITVLWKSCPSIKISTLECFLTSFSDASPNKWNRLLSAVLYLVKDCPHAQLGLTSFAVKFLRIIDDMDIQLIKHSDEKRPETLNGDVCAHCQGVTSTNNVSYSPPRKRTKFASLSNLHDEDITTTSDLISKGYRPKYQLRLKEISLKAVLSSAKKRSTNSVCRCIHNPTDKLSKLKDDWALVRSRGYKKFMSIFHHHPSSGLAWECRGFPAKVSRSRQPRRLDTNHLLQLAYQYCQSPCIRVCLLLVASSLGRDCSVYYMRIVKSCWTRFLSTKDPLWLRLHSEFLVEVSFFDRREECWDVFRPLMRYLTKHQKDEENELTQDVFSCIAYVLSRRCRLFQLHDDEIHKEFHECITYITIHYGESKYWVDSNMIPQEREQFLQTLLRVGILGLVDMADAVSGFTTFDEISDKDEGSGLVDAGCMVKEDSIMSSAPNKQSTTAIKCWPFTEPHDLRSAYLRMECDSIGIPIEWTSLLSSRSHDEEIQIHKKRQEKSEQQKESQCPPVMDYLNSDILCLVFSFFGYKRLVKSRAVCQIWKQIVDNSTTLWHGAYCSRLGFFSGDPRANQGLSKENWRSLFNAKWLAEQNIRFKRHGPTGFKYRICRYIGCLHVVTSLDREKRHHEVHKRREAQKIRLEAQKIRLEARRREQQETGKLKKDPTPRKRAMTKQHFETSPKPIPERIKNALKQKIIE